MAMVLVLAAGTAAAQKGESVMFGDEAPSLMPEETAGEKAADRCEELRREADALRGRPQRRSSAMGIYEAECQGIGSDNAPSLDPARP